MYAILLFICIYFIVLYRTGNYIAYILSVSANIKSNCIKYLLFTFFVMTVFNSKNFTISLTFLCIQIETKIFTYKYTIIITVETL